MIRYPAKYCSVPNDSPEAGTNKYLEERGALVPALCCARKRRQFSREDQVCRRIDASKQDALSYYPAVLCGLPLSRQSRRRGCRVQGLQYANLSASRPGSALAGALECDEVGQGKCFVEGKGSSTLLLLHPLGEASDQVSKATPKNSSCRQISRHV